MKEWKRLWAVGHTRASQPPTQEFQIKDNFAPGGHLAMSEHMSGCHSWEAGTIGI